MWVMAESGFGHAYMGKDCFGQSFCISAIPGGDAGSDRCEPAAFQGTLLLLRFSGSQTIMHPVIKIVSFLVFGAAVSIGNGHVLLAGVSLLLPLYLFGKRIHFHASLVMLKRLKWLFVSILVVYLFFTPGQLLWPGVDWSPTFEGLSQGLLRVAVLVLLVAAVNFLISSTEQDDFLSAILWCLRPLSLIGLPHERLAVRITLTIDEVSQIRKKHLYDGSAESTHNKPADVGVETISGAVTNAKHPEPKLLAIAGTANRLFRSVITTAETTPVREISLPEESTPPLHQWLMPVLLVALFSVVKVIDLNNYL